jgi:DNA-binding transcriptional regulator GbsR (MarR family)
MAGRVLGWLLVCDPPEQTMQDISEQLQASMGSVSTMTRLLDQVGVIERVSLPGDRRVRFRVRPSTWARAMEAQLERTRSLQEITERGLALLEDSSPERRARLEITRRYTSFYLDELPPLLARWDEISAKFGRR